MTEKKKEGLIAHSNYASVTLGSEGKTVIKHILGDKNPDRVGLSANFLRELAICTMIDSGLVSVDLLNANLEFALLYQVKDYTIDDDDDILIVIRDLVCHLHTLHSKGILHKDISENNVMCSDSGNLRLIDFGASLPEELAMPTKGSHNSIGGYISPGLTTKSKPTRENDVWALGVTLIKLIWGKQVTLFISREQIVESLMQHVGAKKEQAEFLSLMLDLDTKTRYTTSQLLQHKYLSAALDCQDVKMEQANIKLALAWLEPFAPLMEFLIEKMCVALELSVACGINTIRMFIQLSKILINNGEKEISNPALWGLVCLNISCKTICFLYVSVKHLTALIPECFDENMFSLVEINVIKLLSGNLFFPPFSSGKFKAHDIITSDIAKELIKRELSKA